MRAKKPFISIALILILVLCFCTASIAEVRPIPIDKLEHGTPPREDGWITPNKEYQDESIHVELFEKSNYKAKSSDHAIKIHWVVVEIKDPSQLRTVLSYDSFEVKAKASATEMIPYINAVVAFNDDYVKMNNFRGYVIRQGEMCLDNLDEWEEAQRPDVLLIDDQGDFSVVRKATSADVHQRTDELAGVSRQIVNAFTFGPTLILNGELLEINREASTHSTNLATARTVFCQLGPLKYAVFTADSPATGDGMNCKEIGEFILKNFPECQVAYNLDGGGSSELFLGKKKVNKAIGRREIHGMIYFASAASED